MDLAAIKERAEKATPGPWVRGEMPEWEPWMLVSGTATESWEDAGETTTSPTRVCDLADVEDDNAAFIAHAREDVPALVARVEELERALRDVVARANLAECAVFHNGRDKAAFTDAMTEAARVLVDGR
jgi:hypothetical protein